MLSEELQNFKNNMKQPWGMLFYKTVWAQLGNIIDVKDLKILDFGSGFGTTASYLAKNNEVIAIEPDADMAEEREQDNNYTQIVGKIEELKDFANSSFDVVVCHNVLEFAPERIEIVKEFSRVLKRGGILSIVKHVKTGRVIHAAVFNNDADEAIRLLDGGGGENTFGRINYYNPDDLVKWGGSLAIEKILGTGILGRLQQNNDIKYDSGWIEKMFELEMKVCDLEPYKSIAFLNHVLLRKL